MKKIILLILLSPTLAFGQADTVSLSYKDNEIIYEATLNIPNTSKDILYSASKKWLADTFKSAKAVIQTEDKASGQIVGTGMTTISGKLNWAYDFYSDFIFNIQLNVKDDKYRIRFYDIKRQTNDLNEIKLEDLDTKMKLGNKRTIKDWEVQVLAINERFNYLIDNFHKEVIKFKSDGF